MEQYASLRGLRCPNCNSGHLAITGLPGALGASLAKGLAFGTVGNLVAGKQAAANTQTEPLQYKCRACGHKFVSPPLIAPEEERLSAPCTLTFTRTGSFVGAAVPQIVYLNGIKQGPVKNGRSLQLVTHCKHNVVFVTDQFGVVFKSLYQFEAQPGGQLAVSFKRGFPKDDPGVIEALQEGPQPSGPAQVLNLQQAEPLTSLDEPVQLRPGRALLVFGVLALSWLLLMLLIQLQLAMRGRWYINHEACYLINAAMLGASACILLQKGWQYKLLGLLAGLLSALLKAGTFQAQRLFMTASKHFSLLTVMDFSHPEMARYLPYELVLSLLCLAVAYISFTLAGKRDKRFGLNLAAGLASLCYLLFSLFFVRAPGWPILMFWPTRVPFKIFLLDFFSILTNALAVGLVLLVVGRLSESGRSRVKLHGTGLVWAWICAIAMPLSFIAFLLSSRMIAMNQLVFNTSLLLVLLCGAGYILLLCRRRFGLTLILLTSFLVLGGQAREALTRISVGDIKFGTSLINTMAGAVNPLFAWLAVSAADRRARREAGMELAPEAGGFDKLAAVVNLILGWQMLGLALVNLLSGAGVLYTLIFCVISIVYLLFGIWAVALQTRARRPFPAWLRIVGLVLFIIVCIGLAFGIYILIRQVMQ